MDYFTYIVYSKTANLHYAGISSNIEQRLKAHNKGKTKTTKIANDWAIVYSMSFNSRTEAYQHEKHIKGIGPKRFLQGQV